MTSRTSPTAGRTVARLVAPIVWRLGLMVALVGVVAVGGILLSLHSLDRLDDAAERATLAEQRVTEALADVQAGSAAERPRLFDALDDLDATAAALDASEVRETVAAQRSAVEAWLADDGPRPEAAYRAAHASVLMALTEHSAELVDATDLRLRLTMLAAVMAVGAGWLVVVRSRVRLQREIALPLQSLERVVHRMARHEPEARGDVGSGPSEVRALARALNEFADAQSHARAVEGRIQDELHVLDTAKDDFVSNVTHELRTPLTTISAYLEMVADEFEGRLDPHHDRMLEATRRNVVRLRGLIDDLLAQSKAEHRSVELESADVVEIVTDTVTDVRMTGARRGICVELTAPAGPTLVVGDRSMLYRALLNLLANAVKFSHDGGTVAVSVVRTRNLVEIAVRDHGIGIPADELDRLGTRFFRASNARSNEIAGTGLGLRIVQTIIDQHQGDVVIESTEGEGTTVVVRLRRADHVAEHVAEDVTEHVAAGATGATTDQSGARAGM